MDFLKKFEAFVRKHDLLREYDRILLAVSGGIDSVVLLDLFLRIQPQFDLTLAVAHMNHGLRGSEADRDENFVRNLAREFGLPFFSRLEDVRTYSRQRKLSLEEGAREVRFNFLESLLDRLRFDRLALGHHANDQAETILMNLVRGAGLRGLSGIRPMRGRVIHPLLFATRKEIEFYSESQKLNYVVDASNQSRRFLRNRIRWDVLKNLEKTVGPHVFITICRVGNVIREAEVFLENSAANVRRQVVVAESNDKIVLDIYKFLSYFKVIQKTVLIQILEEVSFLKRRVRLYEIDEILKLAEKGRSGGVVDLGNGVKVVKTGDKLVFMREQQGWGKAFIQIGQSIDIEDGFEFRSALMKKKDGLVVFTNDRRIEYLDYDTLSFPLLLRSYSPGDRFVPLGMKGKKKLQDFFVDEAVPNYCRSLVPLLVGGEDIIWVVGYRIDDRFKVTEKTRNVLKVEIIPYSLLKK